MFYYRLISTGEVLGAAMSESQDADWIARYAEALSVEEADIEEFEAESDPRPSDARTEPAPAPQPEAVNRGDLLLGIFATLGKEAARGLARDYPDAVLAIDHGNWPVLAESMGDMLADGALTQQQFSELGALFAQFGLDIPTGEVR